MSFVRPRELVSFDPCHVTRSPPIGNVFELGGITTIFKVVRGAGPPSIDLWSSSDTFNEYIINAALHNVNAPRTLQKPHCTKLVNL